MRRRIWSGAGRWCRCRGRRFLGRGGVAWSAGGGRASARGRGRVCVCDGVWGVGKRRASGAWRGARSEGSVSGGGGGLYLESASGRVGCLDLWSVSSLVSRRGGARRIVHGASLCADPSTDLCPWICRAPVSGVCPGTCGSPVIALSLSFSGSPVTALSLSSSPSRVIDLCPSHCPGPFCCVCPSSDLYALIGPSSSPSRLRAAFDTALVTPHECVQIGQAWSTRRSIVPSARALPGNRPFRLFGAETCSSPFFPGPDPLAARIFRGPSLCVALAVGHEHYASARVAARVRPMGDSCARPAAQTGWLGRAAASG